MEIPDSSAKRVTAVQPTRALTFWPVVRVASGNFLEMHDFQVFGYLSLAKVKNTSKINNIRRGCISCYMDDVQTTWRFGE